MTADAEVPAAFVHALTSLRAERLRPEVRLTEIPAPGRIAPFAVALTAEVSVAPPGPLEDEDPTTGRFVLLHDPAGQEAWQGTFRVVTLVRATLDPEVAADPLLCEAAWSWVGEALASAGAPVTALGGTVTRVQSQSFGALAERPDAGAHLAAWSGILCTAAGLPPLPDGVTSLGRRR
jgi:hypothetical protein